MQITEAVMTMLEMAKQIGESANGYRQHCCDLGFSEESAEAMALEMHSALIALLMRTAT